ncbi:MAG: hypothetical protein IIZ47_03880 [Erysipelotrichaceae bacterium]|nr:hypothetical protein [Erysipelotrichaceae bacterium]
MAKKETKKKKKMSRSAVVLIIGLFIILIPCLVFAGILLSSYLKTGQPIIAHRFDTDLDPAITEEEIGRIETLLSSDNRTEKADIELITAQMRVNVDTVDSISKDDAEALVDEVYNHVNSILPVRTYFTATDDKKMYDLTITLFNKTGNDDGNMICYILTKNSKMEVPETQLVSEPLDEELAKELRGEVEAETSEVSTNESDLVGGEEE